MYIWIVAPSGSGEDLDGRAVARAEAMLALAEAGGVDVAVLSFVARRFERRLGMMDAAGPVGRRELEKLVAEDFDELATVYGRLRALVERMPAV